MFVYGVNQMLNVTIVFAMQPMPDVALCTLDVAHLVVASCQLPVTRHEVQTSA